MSDQTSIFIDTGGAAPGEFFSKGEAPGNINPHLDDDESASEKGEEECPDCGGDGEIDLTIRAPRIVECEKCDGTGYA